MEIKRIVLLTFKMRSFYRQHIQFHCFPFYAPYIDFLAAHRKFSGECTERERFLLRIKAF